MNIDKSGIFQSNKANTFTGGQSERTSAQVMDSLTLAIGKSKDFTEAARILDLLKGFNQDVEFDERSGIFRFKNYYVIPGFMDKKSDFIKNLKFINKVGHCKTSAPELADVAFTKDNKFCAIVYKINDTQGGKLLPYDDSSVSDSKRKQFLDEQLSLLSDTSLYNSAVVDSYDYWCLTPDSGNIFIDSWENLKKCLTSSEKDDTAALIRKKLYQV